MLSPIKPPWSPLMSIEYHLHRRGLFPPKSLFARLFARLNEAFHNNKLHIDGVSYTAHSQLHSLPFPSLPSHFCPGVHTNISPRLNENLLRGVPCLHHRKAYTPRQNMHPPSSEAAQLPSAPSGRNTRICFPRLSHAYDAVNVRG